jgi:hypothetical protein
MKGVPLEAPNGTPSQLLTTFTCQQAVPASLFVQGLTVVTTFQQSLQPRSNMSTPIARHRKYHSSSALSTVLDSPGPSARQQQKVAQPANASLAYLPGLMSPSKPRSRTRKEEEVPAWLDDVSDQLWEVGS